MTKHNQPTATPITEEALREKGFTSYMKGSMRKDSIVVFTWKFNVSIDTGTGYKRVPGCKAMQDIDDLIRLLGGEE